MEFSTFAIDMPTAFRGLRRREGMVVHGPAGWAEFSPFRDYSATECVPWLRAALDSAERGWPTARRDHIEVNCTIAAISPAAAAERAQASGCQTAKVKVAEAGQDLADDVGRVAAVRDALGPHGHIRVDANGVWDVDTAVAAIDALDRAAGGLQYVEQPCATVEDLARVRRRVSVPIAADESIRRADDPMRVVALDAADVAVVKVQPLGGVHACLDIAQQIGLPTVVSSAVETSVGLAAGLALAAALEDLPYACGLGTTSLLADDVVTDSLRPVNGRLPVGRVAVDPAELARVAADAATEQRWQSRLADVRELL